jgi:F-type H+-transporting ATPase subunit a
VPRLSRKRKVLLGALGALALIVLGALLFPVPEPSVHLAANYGGDGAEPFAKLGPIWVTNTLIASWISVVVLALTFYLATRKMKLVPGRFQSIAELAVELLLNFCEGVAGSQNARRFFAVVATIFLFVLANAWIAFLPIFNFIGYGDEGSASTLFYGTYEGFLVETALFRGANTDVNVPLMLALVSFIAVEYWGISSLGVRHYARKFFRFGQILAAVGQLVKGHIKSALSGLFYGAIDVFVGILELVSEFVRIVSFTFRLFGNMTAGEILLIATAFVVPAIFPLLFYGLEALFGFVQALIFAGLTLVFATMAVAPHESEH